MAKRNNDELIVCPYCGKKHNMSDLEQNGYIDILSVGKSVWCPNPKCNAQFLI